MVEQLPLKEMVPGSSPGGRTKGTKIPPARDFVLWSGPERCPAIAGPRGGIASEFADEQTRLVMTKSEAELRLVTTKDCDGSREPGRTKVSRGTKTITML